MTGFGLCAAIVLSGDAQAAGEGARWGARDPITQCAEIAAAQAPSADEVAGLVRCERETITASDELWLLEDLSVRVGGARDYRGDELMSMPDVDTAKPVHSLKGSWTWVVCRDPKALAIGGGNPALNCSQSRVDKAEGACWTTSFGTWRCNMTGPSGASTSGYAPPR